MCVLLCYFSHSDKNSCNLARKGLLFAHSSVYLIHGGKKSMAVRKARGQASLQHSFITSWQLKNTEGAGNRARV